MATTKQSQITVRELMTKDPVCVERTDDVREVARIFDSNEISGAPVLDDLGRVIGVVSKTDLLHRALEGPLASRPGSFFELMAEGMERGTSMDPEDLGSVEDFMSTDVLMAKPDEPAAKVARRMAAEHVHRLIVVDQNQCPIGIVTALDVLAAFPG
ncbi:MAG: CBS domain-containing protein [Planctomycetota bacterium]|jgi:CBS domain-containing protein